MGQFAGPYQRLSVQDAGFLYLEHAGLPQHVAILAVAEGGPLHDPDGRLRVDAIRQQLAGRLQLVPRLRQRVLWPRVGQGLPLWVDDPGFDLANHVHAVQVPAPGGERELLGLCDELCLRLLDRTRPLWELWLVAGLANGRVGLVLKLHHSLADGLAAVQLAGLLLEHEGPGAVVGGRHGAHGDATAQDQRSARFDHGDVQPNLRVELDLVSDGDGLPLGDDPVGAVDVAADQVLQRVVAVEAAPALSELGDPGPDLLGRGTNGDGPRGREVGVGDEVIAGEGPVGLLVGRAPPKLPWPGKAGVGGRRASNGDDAHDISTSHRCFSLLCPPAGGRPWPWVLARHCLGTRARVRADVVRRRGPPVRQGPAGLQGGDGGVDQDALVGGVAEVDLGLGDQGTPDRPQGGLGS